MKDYPTKAEALEALDAVITSFVTGQIRSAAEAHAGYILQGYAMSVAIPDTTAAPLAQHEIVAHLQQARANPDSWLSSLPWGQILPPLMNLLLKYLGGLGAPLPAA